MSDKEEEGRASNNNDLDWADPISDDRAVTDLISVCWLEAQAALLLL